MYLLGAMYSLIEALSYLARKTDSLKFTFGDNHIDFLHW